ncbi:MAG: ParB/RepB/Spo0J family partition protein [Deltaproteobacteria bacterium]|nr:ParB/RepB/Spo0J family partition protein [Deltaproteobacteria bacterium]
MQQRKALGRGLDSLIPAIEKNSEAGKLVSSVVNTNIGDRVKNISVDLIVPNRVQPRKVFDEEKINELAASIKTQGIIQPLIVTPAAGGRYELIAGERRLRASKAAGLSEVPVVIKNVDTEGMLEMSLIENIQREDLNPIEEASAIKELIEQFNYTQDEAATDLGKSRAAIANSLRLLNLPKIIQDDVASGRLSAGHARALLSVQNLPDQLRLREKILNSQLTVREIEMMVQGIKPKESRSARKAAPLSPQMKFILDEITKKLATKISLMPDREKKGGKILIEYYTPQDLDRIYNVIVN